METNLPTVLVEALMIGIYTDNLECLLLDDAAAFSTHTSNPTWTRTSQVHENTLLPKNIFSFL